MTMGFGVEVTEAQGEGVHGAQAGLFGEAFIDEFKGLAFHSAAGVIQIIEQHGRFKHGHGRVQSRVYVPKWRTSG